MWPVYVSQLVAATAPEARPLGDVDEEYGRSKLYRAIASSGMQAEERDVVFVVESAMHGEVDDALARGALSVVPETWMGLGSLPAEHKKRVLVSANPLAAFRLFGAFMRSRLFLPVVAVGGSNGKTTTKEMIVAALSGPGRRISATPGSHNGWVGTPITLCHPWHTDPLPDALVLEIGIDEKDAMVEHVALARPNLAVITALGVEHLAGLGSHEEAIDEELELFRAPRRIWLADEPALAARLHEARERDIVVHDIRHRVEVPCPTLAYSWRSVAGEAGELELSTGRGRATVRVDLPGAHNGRNGALAIATALALGRTLEQAARGFASFQAPKQRCTVQRFATGGVLIDDTYNANPSSVEAALDVLENIAPERPHLLVLGDMLDLGPHSASLHEALVPRIERVSNAHVRLYGEHMSALAPKLTRALSIGRAKPSADPTSLVDVRGIDEHVILVKGSRGLRLERVVEHVNARVDERRALKTLR